MTKRFLFIFVAVFIVQGIIQPAVAQENNNWLYEMPIYETHPYYYPNHSFKEITQQIPQLKELGIKTLYLMPIWERALKRRDTTLIYLINDYYKIDPAYGTADDLRELINTAHANGMKILFDLVTCCAPAGSVVYNKKWTYSLTGPQLAGKAKEMNWNLEYKTVEGRNFVFSGKHEPPAGGKDLYEFAGEIFGDKIMVRSFPIAGWGPATDLGNPEVIKYFTAVAEYYVKEYDIDGWRIDAPANNYNPKVFSGNHSSEKVLISAINAVKKIKPDAAFISEPGLLKDVPVELEYVNLPRNMIDIAKGSVTSQQFVNKLAQGMAARGRMPLFVAESHDQSRLSAGYPFLDKNFLVLISTLTGVPFIQAGQEIGETKDWFRSGNANPQVDWKAGDYALRNFYKKVFAIRNSSNALKYGDIKNIWKSGGNVYAYSRTYGNETVVVVVNFHAKEATSILNLPFKSGAVLYDEISAESFAVNDPQDFKISVPAFGSRILTVRQASFGAAKQTNSASRPELGNSKNGLRNTKVAVLYENITEGPPVGKSRTTEEIIQLLKETAADLIFRAFWRWGPLADSPDNIPAEFVKVYAEGMKINPEEVSLVIEKSGYNYAELEKRISAIKKELPDIIFVGAIPAQRINRIDRNDKTERVYKTDETWSMALDPQKWDIKHNGKPFTKKEFQAMFAKWHGCVVDDYDPAKVEAYFPDITNPDYQELLLSWAYKQIDSGADAIWIDGLPQTSIIYPFVKDLNHPVIKDFYDASKKIIAEIHNYGESKGRRIYVGSWGIPLKYIDNMPYLPPDIDFVTITPVEEEIRNIKLESSYEKIANIRKIYGDIPVLAFIDWGPGETPTTVFSQKLNKEEQKELLKTLDESFTKSGVNFIYPLHGGDMGRGAIKPKLAFGKYRRYDALAPEFDTYETIKELAQNKTKVE